MLRIEKTVIPPTQTENSGRISAQNIQLIWELLITQKIMNCKKQSIPELELSTLRCYQACSSLPPVVEKKGFIKSDPKEMPQMPI